jgi:hypothetical protein
VAANGAVGNHRTKLQASWSLVSREGYAIVNVERYD